ncbi:YCF48-related protein [Uliginosibacterium sediminicola]
MQAVVRAGSRLVSAGERGIILLSDDNGLHWRQAAVPVSVSLTALSFPSPRKGWAAGHAGVLLHTEDGGETWQLQLDGRRAAELYAESARNSSLSDQAALTRLRQDAERMLADGPDKPFLDVHFVSDYVGFAVGAYGLVFRTRDGGRQWQPLMGRLSNPKALHFYAVKGMPRAIYLAGEQGMLWRSTDLGEHFERLSSPYSGSLFALQVLSDEALLVGGLKGQVFRSSDAGRSFSQASGVMPVSINAFAKQGDGTLWLINQAGWLQFSIDQGAHWQTLDALRPGRINALELSADERLIVAGFRGLQRLDLPTNKP